MSGPIVRKYGFPNFDKIFGERPSQHGVEDSDSGTDSGDKPGEPTKTPGAKPSEKPAAKTPRSNKPK
jgi:hypothetical protein